MSEPRHVRVEPGTHPEDDGTGVWLWTPFSGQFVRELKEMVPWQERAWDEEERAWFVREERAEEAVALVVHHFGETLVVDVDGGEEYRDRSGTTARQERLL